MKLLIIFPPCALPSPMLAECEVWAMVSYPRCWLKVEIVQRFVLGPGEFINIL